MSEADFRAGFDTGETKQKWIEHYRKENPELDVDSAWAAHSQKAPGKVVEPPARHKSDCLCAPCLDTHAEKLRAMAEGMVMPTPVAPLAAPGDGEMDIDDLRHLEALISRIAPGKWTACEPGAESPSIYSDDKRFGQLLMLFWPSHTIAETPWAEQVIYDTADFLANSRENMLSLIAGIRRLRPPITPAPERQEGPINPLLSEIKDCEEAIKRLTETADYLPDDEEKDCIKESVTSFRGLLVKLSAIPPEIPDNSPAPTAEKAPEAGTNYVADHESQPKQFKFVNGRRVWVTHDGYLDTDFGPMVEAPDNPHTPRQEKEGGEHALP